MINKLRKGKKNEKKSEVYLAECGFELIETVKSVKSFGSIDFFGLWDHIAVCTKNCSITVEDINSRKNTFPMSFLRGEVLFIQTKTNKKPSANKMREHIDFYTTSHKLLVIWKDRTKEPRLISLNREVL